MSGAVGTLWSCSLVINSLQYFFYLHFHLLGDIHSGAVIPQSNHRGAQEAGTEHCRQVHQRHLVDGLLL